MEEVELPEADGELQIVTECWVEPQYGISVNNPIERKHFDGLAYKEIASSVSLLNFYGFKRLKKKKEKRSSVIFDEKKNTMKENLFFIIFCGSEKKKVILHSTINLL